MCDVVNPVGLPKSRPNNRLLIKNEVGKPR